MLYAQMKRIIDHEKQYRDRLMEGDIKKINKKNGKPLTEKELAILKRAEIEHKKLKEKYMTLTARDLAVLKRAEIEKRRSLSASREANLRLLEEKFLKDFSIKNIGDTFLSIENLVYLNAVYDPEYFVIEFYRKMVLSKKHIKNITFHIKKQNYKTFETRTSYFILADIIFDENFDEDCKNHCFGEVASEKTAQFIIEKLNKFYSMHGFKVDGINKLQIIEEED